MSIADHREITFPRQLATTRRFTLGAPRNLSVSPDGKRVLFLRSRGESDPVLCLWELTVASKVERLVVDPALLTAVDADLPAAERARRERARESADGIVAYSLDLAGETAAFALGGSLFVVEIATGSLRLVPGADEVFDPRIDPSGARVAYVSGQDLFLVELEAADTGPTILATDADPLVGWGRAEFIAGEEMGRNRGFWWAPDGHSLLATRVSDAAVTKWWIADPANPDREPSQIRYPAAGTANASVQLWLLPVSKPGQSPADGDRLEIEWAAEAGQEQYEYLADVVWEQDHPPLVVRQPRNQRAVSIATVNLTAGEVAEVHRITDDRWVELMPGAPRWSGQGLLTIEDRAELDRRVLCLNGKPVSPNNIHVRSVVDVNDDHVVVTAWTEPTEIHVLIVPLTGGEPAAITSGAGVHGAVAAGGTIAVFKATPDAPSHPVAVSSADGGLAEIANLGAVPVLDARPQFLSLGKRGLCSALFLPAGHNGKQKLPVLLDPYGGPHAQRVLKNQLPHLTSQWFADQGFAVLVVDNRGTPGRGPAFEREVWGDLAGPVLADQIDALDAVAERFEFLDLNRVGIRGWSFGGYLAALAVLREPERFHAAVAGAPVTDWRLYDTHYTERYLGLPGENPEHYETTDLTLEAHKLSRPLLMIHGLADDNVVAAHTLRLSSALLAAGRQHQVLPLSGVTHMTPQEVVAENLLLMQRDFLLQHLGPSEAR